VPEHYVQEGLQGQRHCWVRCMQAELGRCRHELQKLWAEARMRDQVVKVPDADAEGGVRWCFVHIEVTPDLKGLKALLGIKSTATTNCCPGCTATYPELQAGYEGAKPARDLRALQGTWPALPKERWRFCVLHAMCRVTEKLLQALTKSVWHAVQATNGKPDSANVAAEVAAAYEEVLSESCKVMGGNFKVGMVTKIRGTTETLELGHASLNGGDARLVIRHQADIHRALEPLLTLFPEPQYATMVAKRQAAWTAWSKCQPWFHKLHMTDADYDQAVADLQAFVAAYRQTSAEEDGDKVTSITHYIHLMEKHAEWFLGKGSPMAPALVSTQMMEHMHKFRNTALVRSTMHGMSFTLLTPSGPVLVDSAPECWQLLLRGYRLHHWKLAVRKRQQAEPEHVVDIAQLGPLTGYHQNIITNDILCQALGLPGTKPVRITGRGATHNTCTGLTFIDCSMTRTACWKLGEAGNTASQDDNIVTDNRHRMAHELPEGTEPQHAARKRKRQEAGVRELLEGAALPVDTMAGGEYQYAEPPRKRAAVDREAAANGEAADGSGEPTTAEGHVPDGWRANNARIRSAREARRQRRQREQPAGRQQQQQMDDAEDELDMFDE